MKIGFPDAFNKRMNPQFSIAISKFVERVILIKYTIILNRGIYTMSHYRVQKCHTTEPASYDS